MESAMGRVSRNRIFSLFYHPLGVYIMHVKFYRNRTRGYGKQTFFINRRYLHLLRYMDPDRDIFNKVLVRCK